jgi:hypothetical protein
MKRVFDPIAGDNRWYDLSVAVDGYPNDLRRFAGHLENGKPSVTGRVFARRRTVATLGPVHRCFPITPPPAR